MINKIPNPLCVSMWCFSTNATLDLKKILFQKLWTRTFFPFNICHLFYGKWMEGTSFWARPRQEVQSTMIAFECSVKMLPLKEERRGWRPDWKRLMTDWLIKVFMAKVLGRDAVKVIVTSMLFSFTFQVTRRALEVREYILLIHGNWWFAECTVGTKVKQWR